MTSSNIALRARRLDAPADPIALARALWDAGIGEVSLLHAAEPPTLPPWLSFVAAGAEEQCEQLAPPAGPLVRGPLAGAPRWLGVVPYEACRYERPRYRRAERRAEPIVARPRWLRYPAVLQIDHDRGEVLAIGVSEPAVARLGTAVARRAPEPREPIALTVRDDEPPERHVERIRQVLRLIVAGELYQANLARRLLVELRRGDAWQLHRALVTGGGGAYAAALALDAHRWVLSTSPELLLRIDPDARGQPARLYTEPIKGTRPRGREADADARLVAELAASPKEQAELAMIIDVERNDLGRLATTGSVRMCGPPRVVTHRTLHHRQALLAARARPGLTNAEILATFLPSGSVTGAPKIRAMEVIAALEPVRRGLYTGAIGQVGHDGSVTLGMAIRTLVLDGARGHYFTGGGIVADSDPAAELAETRVKALQLEALAHQR